ncbi:MAG: glycogen/starch/alpha-glucan phosphorylase [Synechococcales bacterium]|nr:glycogen/starch/alpha-glucan phosphorylase [Synechococcales bacterium]
MPFPSDTQPSPTQAAFEPGFDSNQDGSHARESVPFQESGPIRIEDDRTGMDVNTLKRAFTDNLFYVLGKSEEFATSYDCYMALAFTVRDRLIYRWMQTVQTYLQADCKVVCYLSIEYLLGRQLKSNLVNVGLYQQTLQAMQELGIDLNRLVNEEIEPELGNGGMGRLAACYLESMATLEIPAIGYGIRYDYGLFEQVIQNGWQRERPDNWLRFGNPWEIPRPEYRVEVKFGGSTEGYFDEQGKYQVRWHPDQVVMGMPYDWLVPGYGVETVNTLRLWSARALQDFNLEIFNEGDYGRAVDERIQSESISKILYPRDDTPRGQELRLKQEYFFASCSLQDIIGLHLHKHGHLRNLHHQAAIHLNDTHPAISVAELMRLLIDEHGFDWDTAWEITQGAIAFTNHTLLPEAMETWKIELFGRLLPRHLEIIYEINARFLDQVRRQFHPDDGRIARLSIIQENPKAVRMANLANVGSQAINGVSALHTQLLRQETFRDFFDLFPDRFSNKTNGITPRRWVLVSNPALAELITDKLGKGWIRHLDSLRQLEAWLEDAEFRQAWRSVKRQNKEALARYIQENAGLTVDLDSMFDLQVKRIHEYKRQLLNALHVVTLYNRLKRSPDADICPRTVILSGKAAPSYQTAKLIIKLINNIARKVNQDPDVQGRLKVVYLTDFSVSLGEHIYPAADLSEQISMAGKEASGTGNMKFMLNGAVTIGTLDGANIKIREEVGDENFFLFGLRAEEVVNLKSSGYRPYEYYENNPLLREVLDQIRSGVFSPEDPHLFQPLINQLLEQDQYCLLADFQPYIDCQQQVEEAYQDTERWTSMSIINAARSGYFSADRAIREYCQDIWHTCAVEIRLDDYDQGRQSQKMREKVISQLPRISGQVAEQGRSRQP